MFIANFKMNKLPFGNCKAFNCKRVCEFDLSACAYTRTRPLTHAHIRTHVHVLETPHAHTKFCCGAYLRVFPCLEILKESKNVPKMQLSVLQCVAVHVVRYGALQCVAVFCSALQCGAVWYSVVQCVVVRCSTLQCVAVCCSALW